MRVGPPKRHGQTGVPERGQREDFDKSWADDALTGGTIAKRNGPISLLRARSPDTSIRLLRLRSEQQARLTWWAISTSYRASNGWRTRIGTALGPRQDVDQAT